MVANGDEQDPQLYPDRSSPTVALHSIFACLAVAAYTRQYTIAKIDVKGAFIQTEMEGPPVFIRCNKKLTRLIVKLLLGIKKYEQKDGTLFCRLLKALYGCVQASKLWFKKLSKFLQAEGYEPSPKDPCVMRKIVDGRIFLLLIYVDDILLFADQDEIKRMERVFIREFKWITMQVGNQQSYLGMQIELGDGYATITMSNYVDKLLEEYGAVMDKTTPGKKGVFLVAEEARELLEDERKVFHWTVAKLLYLSKRTRPDILTVVSFLCTRVSVATEEDAEKLHHLLGYLQYTREKSLILKPQGILTVEAHIDAAFASHQDSKSHSGIAIFIGGAFVFGASRNQKCITKSPTESELVALTDNISFAEFFAEFFAFIINEDIKAPTIYQDSTSVISLITKGGGVMRTKHLRMRMNLGKEALEMNRIIVKYLHTSKMIADGLTKVLEKKDFVIFRMLILGEESDGTA
jgi:hypothetical protein